jgi:hypothetical protein
VFMPADTGFQNIEREKLDFSGFFDVAVRIFKRGKVVKRVGGLVTDARIDIRFVRPFLAYPPALSSAGAAAAAAAEQDKAGVGILRVEHRFVSLPFRAPALPAHVARTPGKIV